MYFYLVPSQSFFFFFHSPTPSCKYISVYKSSISRDPFSNLRRNHFGPHVLHLKQNTKKKKKKKIIFFLHFTSIYIYMYKNIYRYTFFYVFLLTLAAAITQPTFQTKSRAPNKILPSFLYINSIHSFFLQTFVFFVS